MFGLLPTLAKVLPFFSLVVLGMFLSIAFYPGNIKWKQNIFLDKHMFFSLVVLGMFLSIAFYPGNIKWKQNIFLDKHMSCSFSSPFSLICNSSLISLNFCFSRLNRFFLLVKIFTKILLYCFGKEFTWPLKWQTHLESQSQFHGTNPTIS